MGSTVTANTVAASARICHAARTGRFYRPELDALRFIAFFAVFIHHSLPRNALSYASHGHVPMNLSYWFVAFVNAGGFGVDLFFALSSYLITELLLRELHIRGKLDVKAFWIRRALRIWPLYFLFIGIALVLSWVVPTEHFSAAYLVSFLVFGANWACTAWSFPVSVAGPLWSVSIEEQFYLSWPLLLRTATPRRVVWISFLLLAIAWLTRVFLMARGVRYPPEAEHPTIWCNTFARLDPIALGALLAVALRGEVPNFRPLTRVSLFLLGLLALTSVARYAHIYEESNSLGVLIGYPTVGLGVIAIILSFLGAARNGSILLHRWFIDLGRISYGLYVFHQLGLLISSHLASGDNGYPFAIRWPLALATTFLLASLSYRFIESPFLRLKERFTYVPSRPQVGESPNAPSQSPGNLCSRPSG